MLAPSRGMPSGCSVVAACALGELQAIHCWPVTIPPPSIAAARMGQATTVTVTVAVSLNSPSDMV